MVGEELTTENRLSRLENAVFGPDFFDMRNLSEDFLKHLALQGQEAQKELDRILQPWTDYPARTDGSVRHGKGGQAILRRVKPAEEGDAPIFHLSCTGWREVHCPIFTTDLSEARRMADTVLQIAGYRCSP